MDDGDWKMTDFENGFYAGAAWKRKQILDFLIAVRISSPKRKRTNIELRTIESLASEISRLDMIPLEIEE